MLTRMARMARMLARMARMLTRMTRWLAYYTHSVDASACLAKKDLILMLYTRTNKDNQIMACSPPPPPLLALH